MFPSRDGLESVPSAFLADLCALGLASAQIANENSFFCRMHVGYSSWACVYAFAAAYALRVVHEHGAGSAADAECFDGACFDTWIIFALSAQMWKLGSRYEHENPDS